VSRLARCTAAGLLVLGGHQTSAQTAPDCHAFGPDYEWFWQRIHDDYVYLADKSTDWDAAHRVYLAQAETASTRRGFLGVIERSIDELYDQHVGARVHAPSSPRLVPTGLDVWAEWRDGRAVVTQLRSGFAAEAAGLVPGAEITAINGVPIRQAAIRRLGVTVSTSDSAALQWALLSALAGRHDTPRRLTFRVGTAREKTIVVDTAGRQSVDAPDPTPSVEWRMIDRDIGYVRVNDLIDTAAVTAFDRALDSVRTTRALVLDLRNTPSGGSTAVAEPMMGRFIASRLPYQLALANDGHTFAHLVSPRGPWTYRQPVVVLVGRWTGSMGEGMAIGFDGMHRATVIGSRMAGLAGAVKEVHLPCSGFTIGFPSVRLLHVNGTPRETFLPQVIIEPSTMGSDRALDAALRLIRRTR